MTLNGTSIPGATTILSLPAELQIMIFLRLGIFDRWSLSLTCRLLAALATSQSLLSFGEVTNYAHVDGADSKPGCFALAPHWFNVQYLDRRKTKFYTGFAVVEDDGIDEDDGIRADEQQCTGLKVIRIWHQIRSYQSFEAYKNTTTKIYDNEWKAVDTCSKCHAESLSFRQQDTITRQPEFRPLTDADVILTSTDADVNLWKGDPLESNGLRAFREGGAASRWVSPFLTQS